MFKKIFSYKWIKENLSMIILIPTVAGGLWQILELAWIGTPYIRFFSVTQLVSDGLLLSFIFFWTFLVFRLMYIAIKSDIRKSEREHIRDNDKPNRLKMIIAAIVYLSALIYMNYIFWRAFITLDGNSVSMFIIIAIEFYVVFTVTLAFVIYKIFILLVKPDFKFDFQKLISWLEIPLMIITFGLIFSLIYLVPLFHRSFFKSEDFRNIKYLDCMLRNENKELKSYYLQYFNDNYIFIRIIEKSGKEYTEVKKFEKLLENSCNP